MLTLRQRITDKHAKYLRMLAFETNQVWNYCNELSYKVFQRERRFNAELLYTVHDPVLRGGLAALRARGGELGPAQAPVRSAAAASA